MQRLFSTFADGWPGTGLLIQRFLISGLLLHRSFLQATVSPHLTVILPVIASVLLAVGLATPYVGILVTAAELWLFFSGAADPWAAAVVSGLGVSLAMIGPGAWSMDARFFGRKHIELVGK